MRNGPAWSHWSRSRASRTPSAKPLSSSPSGVGCGAGTSGAGAPSTARAEELRWELELALIGEHGLALPPETEPLHPSRRDDQLRWRRVTVARVRGQRVRAERLRLLRRVLTLGVWWR